jgi:hypothetical protein
MVGRPPIYPKKGTFLGTIGEADGAGKNPLNWRMVTRRGGWYKNSP